MSILAKLTVTPLLYVIGVLVLLLALCAWQARRLDAKADALGIQLGACASANQANVKTIGELDVANKAWAKACRVDPGEQRAALDALRSERDRLAADLVAARNDREVIYVRSPPAREWADAPVPAAVADQLWPRDRADGDDHR